LVSPKGKRSEKEEWNKKPNKPRAKKKKTNNNNNTTTTKQKTKLKSKTRTGSLEWRDAKQKKPISVIVVLVHWNGLFFFFCIDKNLPFCIDGQDKHPLILKKKTEVLGAVGFLSWGWLTS